jgi:drug/metabolite transporter (DMT)-like permease
MTSALRAGGDQWDNPRYRAIFILWFALLAAWGWCNAREKHDPWLWRWVGVEVVFLGFFMAWYYIRYYSGLPHMSFFSMVGWIIGLSVLVILGGWLWDRRKHRPRLQ